MTDRGTRIFGCRQRLQVLGLHSTWQFEATDLDGAGTSD